MDIKTRIASIFRRRKQSDVSVSLDGKSLFVGNWELCEFTPEGFIVKNSKQREEWHFCGESNGWITGLNKTNKVNPTNICINTKGFPGFTPQLMDKASIAHRKMLLQSAQAQKFK
jgi:hypothetical protein